MLIQIVDGLGIIVANVFTFCYFGNLVTNKLMEIDTTAYSLQWYEFPIKQQKYIILLMAQAQRPIVLSGYFRTSCSLERFKDVGFFYCDRKKQ